MKRLVALLLLAIIVFAVGLYWLVTQPMPWAHPSSAATGDITPIRAALEATVRELSVSYRGRSIEQPETLEQAGEYIERKFLTAGVSPERQVYTVGGTQVFNIRAMLGSGTGKRLIVGSHYDVAGRNPGADDNASGVAVLLELARLLREHPPERPVELVAYTLEEPPSFPGPDMGSAVHARALRKKAIEIEGMVSLEMLGYFTDEPNTQKYPLSLLSLIYPSTGNFIGVVGRVRDMQLLRGLKRGMLEAGGAVPLHSMTSPIPIEELGFSDHRNYWAAGYNAVMVTDTSFFRNPHYHTPSDTAETLDYDRMARVTMMLAHAIRSR